MPLLVSTTDPFWITEEDATEHLPIIMHQPLASIPPRMERTATAAADDRARLKEMASLRQGARLATSPSPTRAVTRPLVGEFPRVKHFRNPLKVDVRDPHPHELVAYQPPPPFVPEEGDGDRVPTFADHLPKMEWSDEEVEEAAVEVEVDPAVLAAIAAQEAADAEARERARVVDRLMQHVDTLVTDRTSSPAVDDIPTAVPNDVIADVLDGRMAVLDKNGSEP